MQLSVDIEGLDDVVRALGRVEQRASIRVIRAAVRHAAKPTISRIKSRLPAGNRDGDSYSLRDSIRLTTERKKNRRGTAVQFRVGPVRQAAGPGDSPGYAIAGGLGKSPKAPNYAAIIEKESPYLAPAFEESDDDLLRLFSDKLRKSVEKAAVT